MKSKRHIKRRLKVKGTAKDSDMYVKTKTEMPGVNITKTGGKTFKRFNKYDYTWMKNRRIE